MDDRLTTDEYAALGQIASAPHGTRYSACVMRNSKKLNGLKFISHAKDGHLTLTEKGQQTLFLRLCIDGLRAVATDPMAPLRQDVATFLSKKGHVTPLLAGGYQITQRGQESLADIDASARS